MNKPIIALDIDDVLAAESEFVIDYSNTHWGHHLALDDYQEHWQEMWGVDRAELLRREEILHMPGIESSYRLIGGAVLALQELSKRYELKVITSRKSVVKAETLDWLKKGFGNIFSEVRFTGFYDPIEAGGHLLTKAEMLQEMGASYLIDDQSKHCFAAAEVSIQALLFGDYGASRHLELPAGVTRCKDWSAVLDYFDGRA